MRHEKIQRDSGMALIVVLGMMLIFSLMMLGFYFMVTGEQKVAISNRDNSVAFYAAEGGLEKMSADLADLSANTPLTVANIQNLGTSAYQPAVTNVTYPIYSVVPAQAGGTLSSVTGAIGGSGPLAGLQGIITPITLTVAADGPSNTEVKLSRQVQDVAVPIFEFGIFSQTALSFFAGPNFDFGGRVATNGNLFAAEGSGSTLTLEDKVTTAADVIRTQLSNGWATSSSYTGTVQAIESAGGCTGAVSTNPPCRPLASTDGSLTGGPGSSVNPGWQTLSLTTYNANIRSKSTGVKSLNLTIALAGATPIDLIRRGVTGESALISNERYYTKASLRILLSDQAASLPGNGNVDANGKPAVVPLDNTLNTPGTGPGTQGYYGYSPDACHPFIGVSPGTAADGGSDFFLPPANPMIGGYIEIDMQLNATPGTWTPVTMEILNLGITGTPGSSCLVGGTTYYPIVHLEELDTLNHTPQSPPASTDYIPINMYDPREGEQRDVTSLGYTTLALGGIMNVVEFDVGNLQKWFACTYPTGVTPPAVCSGTLALESNSPENAGYIVYFSDRRNNHATLPSGAETAEYGNEDIVNPLVPSGCPNGSTPPDPGEDVNGNGTLDTYGATPNLNGVTLATAGYNLTATNNPCSGSVPELRITLNQAAKNPVVLFRRALRLIDGSVGSLPPLAAATAAACNPSGTGGFSVAAENPIYVMGDYNANTSLSLPPATGTPFDDNAGACHVPAAVAGDAVTLLSNSWWSPTWYSSGPPPNPLTYQGDYNSFASPDVASTTFRTASTTAYRIAVIGGKNISFPQPTGYTTFQDFGTDGGAHNFLRFIEDWNGQALNYRGSIISLYYSRQATGIYKYTPGPYEVYGAPSRGYHFDTDFLSLQSLPPGTPRFTDVNALSFEQALLPNQ